MTDRLKYSYPVTSDNYNSPPGIIVIVEQSSFQAIISLLNLAESDMKDAIDLLVDYLHGIALAMRYNAGHLPLTVDMTGGPLKFYLEALEGKSQQKDWKVAISKLAIFDSLPNLK